MRACFDDIHRSGTRTSSSAPVRSARRSLQSANPARPGLPPPDVMPQFRIAAYLCGLGEIGLHKLFLSRKFGPLNRQAFILTDAELRYWQGQCLAKLGHLDEAMAAWKIGAEQMTKDMPAKAFINVDDAQDEHVKKCAAALEVAAAM